MLNVVSVVLPLSHDDRVSLRLRGHRQDMNTGIDESEFQGSNSQLRKVARSFIVRMISKRS